jgi:hypothetical protein
VRARLVQTDAVRLRDRPLLLTQGGGKLAIPFMQTQGVDGTIHGYTEAARGLYAPSLLERNTRWGVAESLRDMQEHIPFITNDTRFFACHMWHESPDRTDWNKNTSPEERF